MRFFYLAFILLLAACTSTEQVERTEAAISFSAPQILAPQNNTEFVESNIILEWDWSGLEANQLFVLRLWYADESPREIWLHDKSLNAHELVDSFSRDIGIYHWQVAVVNLNDDGGFASMGSDWSEVQTLNRVRRLSIPPLANEDLSDTARFIASQNFATTRELIDFTRNWVFQNTFVGSELTVYEPDYSDAAQKMFEHSEGLGDAPQMYCNGMSTTMLTILRELGIESRLVFLYAESPGWISEHTQLEVFNPDTQQWEIQDVTFNQYFFDTATNEIASNERLIFGSVDSIVACVNDICDPTIPLDVDGEYFGAFRYGYSTEVFVNPDRFNISVRVDAFNNENFPEFIAREAGVPVREMVFRFETWD